MPTAARLVGALFFAALGWFSADLVKPLLPEGTQTGWFNETVGLVGMFMGWTMAGARAGSGIRTSLGYGLTTSALIVFWSIFIFAGNEMLDLSLKNRFHGPMDAIKAMIAIGIEHGRLIAVPGIIGTVIVGGLFGGWLVEWTSRRWS